MAAKKRTTAARHAAKKPRRPRKYQAGRTRSRGGAKGQAILAALAAKGGMERPVREVADEVGCTPGRIYEVLRSDGFDQALAEARHASKAAASPNPAAKRGGAKKKGGGR